MSIAERGTARGVDLKEPAGSGWMNPDWLRQDKVRAQAGSLADTPEGNWLKPGQIMSQTLELSRWYLGHTPEGPTVFGVVPPGLRSRQPGKEGAIPLANVLAFERAKDRGFRYAVMQFYRSGALSLDQARAQLGGMDPFEAVDELSDLPRLQSRKSAERRLPLKTFGSDSVLSAVGTVAAVTLTAESAKRWPKKDEQGRRYRLVRGLYVGSTVLTTVGLALSACMPQPAEVAATGTPAGVVSEPGLVEENHLTLSVVQEALLPWTAVDIGDQQQFRLNGPVIFIGEADEPENLLTVSPAREDGSVETSVQWAVGKAEIKSSRDGALAVMPMLVEYDKNSGQSHVYGLFLNEAESNQTQLVFTMGVVQEGQFFKTQLRLVVTRDGNGNSLQVIDLDTNQVLDLVDPTRAGQPPTQVPDNVNQLVDGLIGFLTGAKVVLAQEPSPTPPPTETAEPTATPDPNPQVLVESTHPLWAEVEATVNSLVEHEVKGVSVGVEQVEDRQGNLVDLVVVRERETQNIVVHVDGWADRPDKWVVAETVEGTTQAPFIVDAEWAEIPQTLHLQPQDGVKWYVAYADAKGEIKEYFFAWRNQAEVVNEEQLRDTLYPSTMVVTPDKFTVTLADLPLEQDLGDSTSNTIEASTARLMAKNSEGNLIRFVHENGEPLTDYEQKIIGRFLDLLGKVRPDRLRNISSDESFRIVFWDKKGNLYRNGTIFFTERYLNGSFSGDIDVVAASMITSDYHESEVHGTQRMPGNHPRCSANEDAEFQAYYGELKMLDKFAGISLGIDSWIQRARSELSRILSNRSYDTCAG